MTDATKAVVWNAYYWPFGEVRSITGSATLNLRFPGQYFLVESGLHYNWNRHYDPSTGRYIQADPNRDVIATQPDNLDGGTLTSRGGISGGSQLPIQIASAGDYNRQIGAELPEFVDGSSVYAYARSSPAMFVDPDGRLATPSEKINHLGESCSTPNNLTESKHSVLIAAKKSPGFFCQNVTCGARTGGVVYPLCQDCNDRLKNGGPPILLENGRIIVKPITPGQ